MKSLSAPITAQAAAEQSGWAEVYDFYLKTSINTPFGVTNIIRITECPGNPSFFTPTFDPEPSATQGTVATYVTWNSKRETLKSTSKTANDKMGIGASNVTTEWATMLAAVDWREVPVVIRKISLSITGATNADCMVLFSGRIDTGRVDFETVQFTASNDFGSFSTVIPRETQHTNCRFNFGDDQCTALKLSSENYKPKTAAAGCSVRNLFTSYAGYTAQAVTATAATDKINLTSHTLSNGHRVRFGGTAAPGGLTLGVWYFVINKGTNDFQVAATYGGSVIDITSTGTSVTMDSETGFLEDGTTPLPVDPATAFAIDLNGTTGFVTIPDAAILEPEYNQNFTVEAWFKASSSQPVASFACTMLSKNDASAKFTFSLVLLRASGKVFWDRYDGGNNPSVTSVSRIDDDRWHHVAIRKSGSTLSTLIDGVQEASSTDTTVSTVLNTSFFKMGISIYGGGIEKFAGSVTELRMWNVARTDAQIQAEMYRRIDPATTGLVGYWKMTEGAGANAADATTNANNASLTNATWLNSYGTDLVNALSTGAITTSSNQSSYEGYRVRTQESAGAHWRFSNSATNPNPSIDLYTPYVTIDFGAAVAPIRWVVTWAPANDPSYMLVRRVSFQWSLDNTNWNAWHAWDPYTAPKNQITNNGASIKIPSKSARYWRVIFQLPGNTPFLDAVIGKVQAFTTNSGGSDLIDPLSNTVGVATIGSDEKTGFEGIYIQTGQSGSWKLNAPAKDTFGVLDWGRNYEGYWELPDSQAGLTNCNLAPWIQFDFGSAVAAKLWRLQALTDVERNQIPRMVQFYSSSSSTFALDVTHELFYELPPQPGAWFDVLIPKAQSKRYWRICVRSVWAESLSYVMFCKITAYANARHWWASGRVVFDAATPTVTLRGVSRQVMGSYSGRVDCADLPAAPALGDIFTIARGCPRIFNACGARQNQENFGGNLSLPFETVIR